GVEQPLELVPALGLHDHHAAHVVLERTGDGHHTALGQLREVIPVARPHVHVLVTVVPRLNHVPSHGANVRPHAAQASPAHTPAHTAIRPHRHPPDRRPPQYPHRPGRTACRETWV